MNGIRIEQDGLCLFEALKVAVEIDGQWREPQVMAELAPGKYSAELSGGLLLKLDRQRREGYDWQRLTLENHSAEPVKLGRFRWQQTGRQGDFLAMPGDRLRLYREGWTMASACGSVRYGERDFELDPDYKKFAVVSSEEYDSVNPNHFSAEYVAVLNDQVSGRSLLTGFISSGEQFTRLDFQLNAGGVGELSIYSYGDGRRVDPGQTVCSEELIVMTGHDGYGLLEKFGQLWSERMKARPAPARIPTGWCSWYYYFEKVTEADVLENARYIAAHRSEYPLEYLQVDDGYQAALGDWLITNDQFPGGLKALIAQIKATGLKPGLWLAPFMVEKHSRLFAEHPEWMVKDASGNPATAVNWRNNSPVAVLDGTNPEVQAHFRRLFGELVAMGVEYVKLDFLMYAAAVKGGVYHDPYATRSQALRRGMQAIREAMGDRFILGCTAPLGAVVGIVDGERTGTDILPRWKLPGKCYAEAPTVYNVCRNIINRRYMHHQLWVSDPDVLIARIDNNDLTENEVMLWFNALYLVGGMTLLTDRFSTLAPQRAELCRKLVAEPDAFTGTRPLDLFEREFPAIWCGRNRLTGVISVGLFNFADAPEALAVDFAQAGLSGKVLVRDHWTGEALGEYQGSYHETVATHSARLVDLIPQA